MAHPGPCEVREGGDINMIKTWSQFSKGLEIRGRVGWKCKQTWNGPCLQTALSLERMTVSKQDNYVICLSKLCSAKGSQKRK